MEPENAEIARRLRRRDPAVLEQLIEQYQHRLMRFLLYFTRDRHMAEDIFQETWLRVLERGRQYEPRYPFPAWLLTLARNLAIDRLRQRHPASLDESLEVGREPAEPAATHAPFDRVAQREDQEQLAQALDGMPAYYREALTLRFYEQMSLEEMARVSNVPLSTVKSRLRRALGQLQRRMESLRT